jgi:hypothetical protein
VATKLQIWNKALAHLGEPPVASTGSATYIGTLLNDGWSTVPLDVLSSGFWHFAETTSGLTDDLGTPFRGYGYRFTKPSDWLRTYRVGTDVDFTSLADYRDATGHLSAQVTPIYLHYISSDYAADGQISTWPPAFVELVALRLAWELCERVTQSVTKEQGIRGKYAERLNDARGKDMLDKHVSHQDPDVERQGAAPARKGR